MTILPIPSFFDPARVAQVWPVPYQERALQAREWRERHQIQPASQDQEKIALLGIDIQNSFCIPGYELFVGGHSGEGAVHDTERLCAFIYQNLAHITHIFATLDTHTAMQIFHPIFLVDEHGNHPNPHTLVSLEDLQTGRWRFNNKIAPSLGIEPEYGQRHLLHYAESLKEQGKYALTIWPYHVMTGSLGNALVPVFEEAIFFHTIARYTQAEFDVKGDHPLTENYSAIGPEVRDGPEGELIAERNSRYLAMLQHFDALIIAGQAKSHCLAWTVEDLLTDIQKTNPDLAGKVYLLEDCTSPVVVPGIVDYTDDADRAFEHFSKAGMHIVRSDQPMQDWLEIG